MLQPRGVVLGDFIYSETPKSTTAEDCPRRIRKRLLVSPAGESSDLVTDSASQPPEGKLCKMAGSTLEEFRAMIAEENRKSKDELKAELLVELNVKFDKLDERISGRIDGHDLDIARLQSKCNSLEGSIGLLNRMNEQAENRNRRNNIIVSGIPMPVDGSKEDVVAHVVQLCTQGLGMEEIFVNRAHRLKANKFGRRDIIAHIPTDWQHREIFKRGRMLKGKNIFVRRDVIGHAAKTEKAMVKFRKLLAERKVKITLGFECFYYKSLKFHMLEREGQLILKQGSICGCYVLSEQVRFDVTGLWASAAGNESGAEFMPPGGSQTSRGAEVVARANDISDENGSDLFS